MSLASQHELESFDLSPLNEQELSRRYGLVMILGQRTIVDEAGVCLPANPPYFDEHGIVGAEYRVQAAVGMHATLGLVSPCGLFGYSGNATRPLNIDDADWQEKVEETVRSKGREVDMTNPDERGLVMRRYCESEALKRSFERHAGQQIPDEDRQRSNPADRAYTDSSSMNTLDALVQVYRTCAGNLTHCEFTCGNRSHNGELRAAFITNWFHVERTKALQQKWTNLWDGHRFARNALGQPLPLYEAHALEVASRWDVISAERLLVTAFGDSKKAEIEEAYLGPQALMQTIRRVRSEAAGLAAINDFSYRLGVA